ncbi:OBAP family protein [Xanthomonas sp. AmX2]|uniref:OBAP family protein n=1 Tax=Xanthomonas sp. TaxID=29446 RepID=UPI00197EAD35|nr:OBAP family protein [Xanthomonas sp.]MBN6151014.1 OBAP family protein [Xanthomonas sp.]
MSTPVQRASPLALLLLAACSGRDADAPSLQPPGAAETPKTQVLEAGAKALQGNAPVGTFDIYLVGFHPMKAQPQMQMEAHHYCRQVNEDFAQCVLFDGNTAQANLNGLEYIISESLFQQLPQEERQYWHPHNGEILSGQLVAPGLPQAAEKELMRKKMNSYGKTWHTWHSSGSGSGKPATTLPLGEAMLAWSFNRDGEVQPALVAARDRNLDIDTEQRRQQRQDLLPLARPQAGVDALRAQFPQARPIPGVTEAAADAARAEPAQR